MKKTICLFFGIALLCGFYQSCQPNVELPGGIYGTVLDKESGEPIRNAEITLNPGGKTTVVGSNGTYEFVNLEAGMYTVNVQADGYDHNSKTANVVNGESTACDFHLTKTIVNQDLEIAPTSLNFGTTQNQLSVTITNRGTEETAWSLDLGACKWLSANPVSGRIGAGKTQAIIFSVDRSLLQKDETTVVTLSAFGNSYPMNVSCAIVQNKGVMNVSPTVLSFGEDANEMSFTIKNLGNANLNWYTQGLSESCLSLSENNGTLSSGVSKVIRVSLNRNLLDGDLSTSFIVSDGNTDQEILVMATKKIMRPIMNVTPSILDFGDSSTSKTFTISNSGSADLHWSLTNASNECLSYSTTSGTISPAGSTTVTVTLNRAAMHTDLNTSIAVSDGNSTQSVTIKATYVYVEDYSSAIVESCDNNLKAEIVSCKRNGTKVEFNFKLTNTGLGDINDFRIEGNSGSTTIIFDDLGNSYTNQTITLGSSTSTSGYTLVSSPLLEYVPCNGRVVVTNVPDEANALTIKLQVYAYNAGVLQNRDYINFKNVPIY